MKTNKKKRNTVNVILMITLYALLQCSHNPSTRSDPRRRSGGNIIARCALSGGEAPIVHPAFLNPRACHLML